MYREICLLFMIVLAADSTSAIGLGRFPALAPVPTKLPQLGSALNFPRCQRGDPAFGECLASAVQKVLPLLASGIPALGFPPFDPWYVGTIDLRCTRGNSSICLFLSNVVAHGFRNSRVLKVTPDMENLRIAITVEENVRFEGKYKMDAVNGEPLHSQGRCNITFIKSQGTFTLMGKTVARKGSTYMHFNNSPLDIYNTKIFRLSFDHLDTDPERNAALNNLINGNSVLILQDIRRRFEKEMSTRFNDLANIIFEEFPIDVMFLGD